MSNVEPTPQIIGQSRPATEADMQGHTTAPGTRPVKRIDHPGGGYYVVASDGGIFAFNAPFFGSVPGVLGNQPLGAEIVDIALTPDGRATFCSALMVASSTSAMPTSTVQPQARNGSEVVKLPVSPSTLVATTSSRPAVVRSTTSRRSHGTTVVASPVMARPSTPRRFDAPRPLSPRFPLTSPLLPLPLRPLPAPLPLSPTLSKTSSTRTHSSRPLTSSVVTVWRS